MKKRVYISGPMTGIPECNFPAFMEAEEELVKQGYEAVNPARNFGGRKDLPYHVYIGRDIGQLITCDEVYVLPGWADSKGVCFEILVALGLDLQITEPEEAFEAESRNRDEGKFLYLQDLSDQAHGLVYGNRGDDYGHPYDDYMRTHEIHTQMLIGYAGAEFELSAPQGDHVLEAIRFMMAVKISRQLNKPKHDNLVDLCGYAICYKRCLERIKENT